MDLLLLCDQDGVVDMTPEAISRRTNVPLEIVLKGLAQLETPDPNSRSQEEDGRRIKLIDSRRKWGWKIVNYRKYREVRSELDRSRLITTNGEVHYGGYVYFMSLVHDESKIKIGYSANPWARVRELATGSPEGVIFIGCIKGGPDTEASWHEKFAKDRLNGEWFSVTPELKLSIESVVDPSLRKVFTRSYSSLRSPKQKQREKQREVPPICPPEGDDSAEEIYKHYPLKVGKPKALKAIRKVIRSGSDPKVVLERTIAYAASVKAADVTPPHPTTWFNQERFNDDPATWTIYETHVRKSDIVERIKLLRDRMAELKRRHHSDVQTLHGGNYIPAGWHCETAKAEYFRLKSEVETLTKKATGS